MAAGAEVNGDAAAIAADQIPQSTPETENGKADNGGGGGGERESEGSESKSKNEMQEKEMVDIISKLKLNPLAEEFIPPSYLLHRYQTVDNNFNKPVGNDGFRTRRSNYNQRKKRFNGKASKAQIGDSIRRTVYVSNIDYRVTEEELAAVFGGKCGHVVDCRICGDPRSQLRFAFVEFADERGVEEALELRGTVIGLHPVNVSLSRTAILPVNPTFLPRSEDEREMCARTVYCTNIDKLVSYAEVKFFFESFCGKVTRLRLLGDYEHSTRIAFVEFAMAESAVAALSCSGMILGNQPIRLSPSKTPVRPRAPHPNPQ